MFGITHRGRYFLSYVVIFVLYLIIFIFLSDFVFSFKLFFFVIFTSTVFLQASLALNQNSLLSPQPCIWALYTCIFSKLDVIILSFQWSQRFDLIELTNMMVRSSLEFHWNLLAHSFWSLNYFTSCRLGRPFVQFRYLFQYRWVQ